MGNQQSFKKASKNDFVIKLYKQQKANDVINPKGSLIADSKRTVFVSLLGLYQTWSQCPVHTLYPSIFLLPIKKQWIYNPKKYAQEFHVRGLSHISIEKNAEFIEFIKLLKWKDSQKLLFCMLDSVETGKVCKENLIAPFWVDFNASLTKLQDPNTRLPYNKIPFAMTDWTKNRALKYVKAHTVLTELYIAPMNFKAMQEILHQSNPSLSPIVAYSPIDHAMTEKYSETKPRPMGFVSAAIKNGTAEKDVRSNFVCFGNNCCSDMEGCVGSTAGEGQWMISADYDEYDCDEFTYE